MKGKSASRLLSLIEKYDRGEVLTRSERRQLRKLLARDEGLGREWRSGGYQVDKKSVEERKALEMGRPC